MSKPRPKEFWFFCGTRPTFKTRADGKARLGHERCYARVTEYGQVWPWMTRRQVLAQARGRGSQAKFYGNADSAEHELAKEVREGR